MSDWTAHAAELARSIGAAPASVTVVGSRPSSGCPRHLFVPRWYERDGTGWVAVGIVEPDSPRAQNTATPSGGVGPPEPATHQWIRDGGGPGRPGRHRVRGSRSGRPRGRPSRRGRSGCRCSSGRWGGPARRRRPERPDRPGRCGRPRPRGPGRRGRSGLRGPGRRGRSARHGRPGRHGRPWPTTTPRIPAWGVTDAGVAGAYRDEALVTALLPDGHGGLAAVSSSTQPSLMVGMLDALDLRDHPRVLEIGTGTGYNAALMCHVLGDAAVHSVDVDPVLVDTARARLDSLGHHPLLAVGDGRAGLPSHAPYDRIIATCAFPEVPWAWAEQLVDGRARARRREGGAARGQPRAPAAHPRTASKAGSCPPGRVHGGARARPAARVAGGRPAGRARRGRDRDRARPAPARRVVALVPRPDRAAAGGDASAASGPTSRARGSSPPTARGARSAHPSAAAAGRSPGAARGASGTTSSAPTPSGGPTDGRAGTGSASR